MPTRPAADRAASSRRAAAPDVAWLVIAGGLVMGLALGARHVQGLFLLPVTADRGWSRETFAFAMAAQNLCWGLTQPFVGMLADRFGSSRVVAAGLLLYAAGLYAMTLAATPAAFLVAAGLLIGLALSCTSFAVVNGALSRLAAPERRSAVLGAAGAVGGLVQFVMVPSVQRLLDGGGWSLALGVLAIAVGVALPLAGPIDDRGASVGGPAGGQSLGDALRDAFGHRGFWLLNAGFLACGFQLAFIGNHLPAYVIDQGLSAGDGMTALAIIALTNVAGIYGCGLAGLRGRRKYLLATIYLARSAAMALFLVLPPSRPALFGFAAVMGFLWLGTVPLTTGLLSQVFGVRYITTLFGFVFFGHQVGSFLGVWLGGRVFEATRSYDPIWFGAIALGLLAAVLHWPIDDRARVPAAPAGAAA